jgi:hypothetical protein
MNLKTSGIASIVTVLTACSSQPTKPTVNAPATAAPAAAVAPPGAPAALQVAATDGNTPPVNRTLLAAGYKPVTIKGEVYYCRTVDVTNTAFKKKVCLNETQIADEEKKIQDMRQEMLRSRTNPPYLGPSCG